MLSALKSDLKKLASPKRAEISLRFFKTGEGQYGEGDVFIGVVVPDIRNVAKKHKDLSLADAAKLLKSKIHEERLTALFILVDKFQRGSDSDKEKIYKLYLQNTKYINNWDLVDLSAPKIVGAYLSDKPRNILYQLAHSKSLWERRIAILATFDFIRQNDFIDGLKIAKILLRDGHDLIHKAVGWQLREIGKRRLAVEQNFLKQHYKIMPRTALRYAIEKFPEAKRKAYLNNKI